MLLVLIVSFYISKYQNIFNYYHLVYPMSGFIYKLEKIFSLYFTGAAYHSSHLYVHSDYGRITLKHSFSYDNGSWSTSSLIHYLEEGPLRNTRWWNLWYVSGAIDKGLELEIWGLSCNSSRNYVTLCANIIGESIKASILPIAIS